MVDKLGGVGGLGTQRGIKFSKDESGFSGGNLPANDPNDLGVSEHIYLEMLRDHYQLPSASKEELLARFRTDNNIPADQPVKGILEDEAIKAIESPEFERQVTEGAIELLKKDGITDDELKKVFKEMKQDAIAEGLVDENGNLKPFEEWGK